MKKKLYTLLKKLSGTHYIDACDEYLNWLLVSNAGMQEKGNIHCFETAIRNLPAADPLIEIGAHAGLSANIMRYLLQKHGKKNAIISVDPWIVRGYHDEKRNVAETYLESLGENKNISRSEYAAFIRESYVRNVNFFSKGNLPFAFESTSDSFFESWRKKETKMDIMNQQLALGGNLSFAFIDGNHDYDFVKRDFENINQFLVPGGYILFDNSEDNSPFGSAKFAREMEKQSDYKLVMKNPNRLFRKSGKIQ